MRYLTHLNSLQALESALRNGSLKAAAEELGITPAAVGQRIRTLEDFLGTPLLVRSRHSFEPGPAMKDAQDLLSMGFDHLNLAAEKLQLQSLGSLAIEADEDWVDLWLRPRLERFKADNPSIEIKINSGSGSVDFRVLPGDPSAGAGVDVLYTDYCVPVATGDLTRRLLGFPVERQLEGLPLLHLDLFGSTSVPIGWPEWVSRFGHRLTGAERGSRYRRVRQAVDGVLVGSGFLICGLSMVETFISEDRLRIAFDPSEGAWMTQPYVLISRPGLLVRPQARRFRDWLLREAAGTQDAIMQMTGLRPE